MPAHLFDSRPNTNLAYHVDAAKNEYFGDAPRGAKTTDSVWRIYVIWYVTPGDQTSSWQILYPDGSDNPAYRWSNVENYTYSLLAKRA